MADPVHDTDSDIEFDAIMEFIRENPLYEQGLDMDGSDISVQCAHK